MIEYTKTGSRKDDTYTCETYVMVVDGIQIGGASCIVADNTYVERIDIDEQYRGQGFGTAFLRELSATYSGIYLAPDNVGAQRLYARIGRTYTGDDAEYLDQGFGVYEI